MFQHSAPSPAWLQHDMERVDAIIRAHMNNDVALIRQVVEFILHGAERRRPALVLASARALGHGGERPHALAAAVELIHISLALHDDVTEASGGAADGEREGALFGNAGNILLGDLLYTSAFRMIVDLGDMEVMRVLSDATNVIAEGEVAYRELLAAPASRTPEAWLDIARRRRAKLFEAGAECMAIVHGADPAARSALARFGLHVGSAHALRSEAEDAARFGIADAQARAQAEIEAARAVADGLALVNAAALGVVVEG
ncbi:MAG TPA: polyprenyl synthetase family protein [Thauera aminoaromatica]|nr:polyprenyl synthetase family protein [Thauera aminoaromatica]HNF76171.1 polyprenyl synthetase family protein [Thauera aminoaromatica]HNG66906.1 polyprenyl synthetase family protein [Thauera aminoaromatica]